jgi:DNA-3-methyladenine glycosylase II
MAVELFDAEETHRRFVGLAEAISPALAIDLTAVGPVAWPERHDGGLGLFLSRAVVGQQLSTRVARVIWNRIEALPRDAGEDVLGIFRADNAQALRACGVSGNKVKALTAIRDAAMAGRLAEDALRAMTADERSRQLQAIWGIGQWTCDMASIFISAILTCGRKATPQSSGPSRATSAAASPPRRRHASRLNARSWRSICG